MYLGQKQHYQRLYSAFHVWLGYAIYNSSHGSRQSGEVETMLS